MKRIKNLSILLSLCLILSMFVPSVGFCASDNSDAAASAKQTGWIYKGNNTYYRTDSGHLIKNQEIRINGETYRFDKNGKLVKGARKAGYYYEYYNSTNGRYQFSYLDLKIKTIEGDEIIASKGSAEYQISKETKTVNSKGRKISASKLKKGQKIRVYFKGDILETYPAKFQKILKIKIF